MSYTTKKHCLLLWANCTSLFLVVLFCISCNSKQSQKFTFVGRWQVNTDKTLSQMSASKRRSYDARPEQVREVLKKSIGDRFYEFRTDSTVVFSIVRRGRTNSFLGTWKYHPDSGKLVTTPEKGSGTTFSVSITSPDQVVLKNENVDARSMLDDWVLQRVKN